MDIDVFISHHTDSSRNIVEAITNKLESNGIRCWYSCRDISGGPYAKSIMSALLNCKIFLLVLNRPASESPHVLNELEIATERLTQKEDVHIVPFHIADENISPETQYYIKRHHWIDAISPPMYQRIDELTEHLLMILGRESQTLHTNESVYRLINQMPQPREVFRGREDILDQIEQVFAKGKRVLFLEGIGGIGKSELAKQYAIRQRKKYDNVVFLTYSGSLQQLICNPSALIIDGVQQNPDESDRVYFIRKRNILASITDERTLLIVDNFDTDDDTDLEEFLQGSYRVIFTTRNSHPGYPTIRVGSIDDMDTIMAIFMENYGNTPDESEKCTLVELFRYVESHTYTIELIAKQMDASFLSAQDMLDLLKKGQLQSSVEETVSGRNQQKTAFNHICALFDTGNLVEDEKRILMYLSLAGIEGIPAVRFKEWSGLKNFELINQLAAKSWLRKESGHRLTLHPVVREVVHYTLPPTVENCHDYLNHMHQFCYESWFRKYSENLEVAGAVEATLVYFKQLSGKDSLIFRAFCDFLWQVARFEASIHHIHRVYEACVQDFGVNSEFTGYVAKTVGGCYFNSRQELASIKWYKQALESMLSSGVEEGEELAMCYEKVARCYTWEYEQDFSKAKEYFEKSLSIRLQLLERLNQGEEIRMIETSQIFNHSYAYNLIGESYMEMGRMYQAMGDYNQAYEYAVKYTKLIEQYRPDNISGVAYGYYDSGVCCYRLALNLRKIGNEDEATKWLEQAEKDLSHALESNIRMRGDIAVDTIDNQECLADVYAAQHRFGQATEGYMATLNMLEKLFGKDNPRILTLKQKMNFTNV